MKTPSIDKVLAHAGQSGQFVNDMLALAEAMRLSHTAVAQKLFAGDQVRLLLNMTGRLTARHRREYADNLDALLREAKAYFVPSRYRKDYRGYLCDLHRRAGYAIRCASSR